MEYTYVYMYICIYVYVFIFQETADSPQILRYYLMASYNFMPVSLTQPTAIASTDNNTNNKETVINLQGSSTWEIQFPTVPYHTRNECNFTKTHIISDLSTFQSWLGEGLTVQVHLQKATFVKEDSTTTSSSRPPSTTRPSSSKKEKPREKVSLTLVVLWIVYQLQTSFLICYTVTYTSVLRPPL